MRDSGRSGGGGQRGSETTKDPGPWAGEQRNMWKPTQQDNLWLGRGSKHVLGVVKVLAQKPFDAPKRPKRGPAPLCLTRCEATWRAFVDEWRAFVSAYRAASAASRGRSLQAACPPWTFRPSMPLAHG